MTPDTFQRSVPRARSKPLARCGNRVGTEKRRMSSHKVLRYTLGIIAAVLVVVAMALYAEHRIGDSLAKPLIRDKLQAKQAYAENTSVFRNVVSETADWPGGTTIEWSSGMYSITDSRGQVLPITLRSGDFKIVQDLGFGHIGKVGGEVYFEYAAGWLYECGIVYAPNGPNLNKSYRYERIDDNWYLYLSK